jgi:CRP-like cAMP-binding protein
MKKDSNFLLEKDLALLRRRGRVVTYAEDQVILKEKETNRRLFWLLKGSVRIELNRRFGNIVLANIRAGEMFGEMSFLGEEEASATVIANKELECIVIDGDVLDEVLELHQGLAARFYHTAAVTLARRLRFQGLTLK